uniref:hypothetical protein n=2 Tax=unclassified Endozoicomonas TaxID=2644528 RepID=UPI0021475C19
MTHARPSALSLAVAVAISSSAIGAQALADRRLQIKSIDIQGNGHTEFTQSEVVVQPTLGYDQQPIPKSYTTTYPDQAEARAGYEVPSEGFTDVLSGISGGVSSVDQFETDDYGVAQKYTKVLKVGNEGVFKFTHYLADNKLLIEVRDGMTHQDSIDAVRGQSSGIQRLEPLTKIASPEQLVAMLKGADERKGSLGEVDHYVPLATLEVDEVIVNGRTFMRLIACGDQPPVLQHLGQSLFVNDEALLAAATSAYTQVHVLGEGIQQKALNDLLSYHKPVGYVVHIEDVAQPYPVPEGYPKMELIQATGEVIVFRSQKQNPTDIAFVEGLYDLWGEFDGNDRASEATAQLIKKDKVKSYQHVIRSRQMALLETLAAEHNANEQTIAAFEDKLVTLAFYESLQQALTSASSDGADEFEFTIPHIRAASSFITPTWMHMQLAKHFVFKPTLRNLLANRYFFQNIQKVIPIAAEVTGDPFAEDERFASKLMGDITGQLFEMESKLEKLQVKEAELAEISKTARETRAMATQCIKENHRAVNLNQLQEAEVKRLRQDLADLKNTKTPNRPKARPEVLETLRAVERALDETSLSEKDDVYLHRMHISYYLRIHIIEARRPKEEALVILQSLERLFNIKIDEGGDKAARLERIRKRLDGGNISPYELDKMDEILWEDHSTALEDLEGRDIRLNSIHARLAFKVEESEQRAREQQAAYLIAVEDELNIYPHEHTAAKERGKTFIAKLASDLQVRFENSASLSYLKHALIARIEALREEANEICDDEGVQRIKNNEIAHQLNIEDYRDDASADEQNSLIKEKLKQLNEQVFKAGQPDVNERIAGIENELDRHMARLGPKPRFVLDREITMAKQTLEQARAELAVVYRKLNAIQGKRPLVVVHNKYPVREGDGKALSRAVQLTPGALGQPAGDEQTPESRVDAVRQMPLQGSEERRDPVIDKLEAAFKKMNIRIRRGDIGLLKKADYIAISASTNTDNRVETDTIDNEPGELLLTRIKYRHVAEFLHEHDKKSMELTNARLEERNAQKNLDRKKQEIKDPGDIDEQAKTAHNKEIAALTLALKQKTEAVLKAKDALTDYHEAGLGASEEAIGLKPDTSDAHEQRINALRKRQVQLGGYDGTGGTIQQLIKKQARLEDEIKTREADIEKMNEVLKAAEEAAEHDGGPFQFTPKQEKARADIHKFVQQHPLKKQALEAALGLTEAAAESGKATPFLTTFDFDDEFAPIRLQTMVGDNLSFDQASRIVEVFKNLKRHFPVIPHEPPEDQSQNVLTTIEKLVFRARHQMKTGAQQYDDEIHGMGLTAVHYVEHEPSNLKGFSEYFTTRSASGKKIIALLREGVISKLELENYIRVVRGVDGYQTVDEFAHFLGYKHAVKVPEFRKVVQMLSDEGAEQFMRIAFTPVTVTATGPAGMTESVTGMKEYAAAVIANYV